MASFSVLLGGFHYSSSAANCLTSQLLSRVSIAAITVADTMVSVSSAEGGVGLAY